MARPGDCPSHDSNLFHVSEGTVSLGWPGSGSEAAAPPGSGSVPVTVPRRLPLSERP